MPIVWKYDCPECHKSKYCGYPDSDLCHKCLHPHVCNCQMKFRTKEEFEIHAKDVCKNRKIERKVVKSKPIPIPKRPKPISVYAKYVDRSTITCICKSTVQTTYLNKHRDSKQHYDRLELIKMGYKVWWK